MIHELKTWSAYFQEMVDGNKPFELRKDDRGFQEGHKLLLREIDKTSKSYTGRELIFKIKYILKGEEAELFGLKKGYCILGLAPAKSIRD
jgi:hypothetical protein